MSRWVTHTDKLRISRYLFVLGVTFCVVLLAMTTKQGLESRAAYCIATVCILLITEALPTQATVMLPVFVFRELEFFRQPVSLMPVPLLHIIAVMLLVRTMDTTSLLSRLAFCMLEVSGSRLRNVVLSYILMTSLLSTILDPTLTVLTMASLVYKAVEVFQHEGIQALHQKALFRKTVTRMTGLGEAPKLINSLLEDIDDEEVKVTDESFGSSQRE